MPKTKEKKRTKGMKVLIAVIAVLLVLVLAAVIFVNVMTRPRKDTDPDRYAVGNMVVSDTVAYQYESGEGIKHHPIVKMMEMVWRFCADGDAAKHAVQTPPDDVAEVTDLAYIDDGNIYHRLDVYYPQGTPADAKLPVIIDIHGGGWIYGDKELNKYYCLELAHKGYTVFNISYRLVPDVTVNEQLQDCAAALSWINEHLAEYPCDPNSILLTGDSAGGQMALYSAALLSSEKLRGIFEVPDAGLPLTALLLTSPAPYMKGNDAFSAYTKILWGKDYKTKATYAYMNPDEIIGDATLPPTYLITSTGDALAHDQTLNTYELLKANGVVCEMKDYDGTDENGKALQHVFSVLDPFNEAGQTAIDGALAFFQSVK